MSSAQTQINIRLDSTLSRKFQNKIKREGWNTTKLVTKWIEEFVETQPSGTKEPPQAMSGDEKKESTPKTAFATESLTTLTEEIDFLNQKLQQLEKTMILLGLMQQKSTGTFLSNFSANTFPDR